MGDALLQPGNNIKPILSIDEAKRIIQVTYGLTCNSVTQLNGYDDINYKVIVEDTIIDNKNIQRVSKNGYVLKVMNSLDSKNVSLVEGQNALMLYLGKHQSIICIQIFIEMFDNDTKYLYTSRLFY